MEKKTGGMNIRLSPDTFEFFKHQSGVLGVGTAKLMVEVLEKYCSENILKKGENKDGGSDVQEVPRRSV